MTDDGPGRFLSRWSRRKAEHREGRTPEQQAAPPEPAAPLANQTADLAGQQSDSAREPSALTSTATESDTSQQEQLPSIEELTAESDFRPFMKDDVDPSTRHAALQRLFADPHFNRICDMDIDIEDFGKFEPIPPAMLRMMDSARSLGFFSEEDDSETPGVKQTSTEADLTQADAKPAPADDKPDTLTDNAAPQQIPVDDASDLTDLANQSLSGVSDDKIDAARTSHHGAPKT